MKRAEIISDSFHRVEVVYNDARCVRDIDRYAGTYQLIFIMLNESAARLFTALRNVLDCDAMASTAKDTRVSFPRIIIVIRIQKLQER